MNTWREKKNSISFVKKTLQYTVSHSRGRQWGPLVRFNSSVSGTDLSCHAYPRGTCPILEVPKARSDGRPELVGAISPEQGVGALWSLRFLQLKPFYDSAV